MIDPGLLKNKIIQLFWMQLLDKIAFASSCPLRDISFVKEYSIHNQSFFIRTYNVNILTSRGERGNK